MQQGEHPGLQAKDQNRLHYSFEKEAGHPQRCALPADDLSHPILYRPLPGQVPYHHQPVIVCHRYHLSQVTEGGHHIQGDPIGAEIPGGDIPLLLR